jgi:hypothetical protein
MKTKTHVRAGGLNVTNHNETLVRDASKAKGLKVKTRIRAGGLNINSHNETLVSDTRGKL